ncbi:MAG: ScpA family protein [Pseudobdellovibrionaceae bacterium]
MAENSEDTVKIKLSNENFEEDPPRQKDGGTGAPVSETDTLLLNIDGYAGPLDVLLDLARTQKVDLLHISILQLVRQYLAFIERAKQLKLELAADYLVMASWLAYLKSRLLLPQEGTDTQEPSGEEMAEALQFQLRRLEAMQIAGEQLMTRPRLGQSIFARGATQDIAIKRDTTYNVSLFDLLTAYGAIERRKTYSEYKLEKFPLMSTEEAVERMRKMLGNLPKKGMNSVWATLDSFMPAGIRDPLYARSSCASLFTASLEMVKQGEAELRQDGLFKPIYLRSCQRPEQEDRADKAA